MDFFYKAPAAATVLLLFAFLGTAGLAVDAVETNSEPSKVVTMKSEVQPRDLTRDYLLAHGFKQKGTDTNLFLADNVRLGDMASLLGFEISAIRHWVGNPPDRDSGDVIVQQKLIVLHSHVRDTPKSRRGTLRQPDTVCAVEISLKNYVPPKPPVYLRTDSSPRLRVKSVSAPKDRKKPLQIAFELAADGKAPLGFLNGQFQVRISNRDECLYSGYVEFPDSAATRFGRVIVKPGSPITLTVGAPDEATLAAGDWDGLGPGKYVVRVIVQGHGTLKGRGFDYMWNDGNRDNRKVESVKFEFTVQER